MLEEAVGICERAGMDDLVVGVRSTFGSALLEPRGDSFVVPVGYGPSYMLGLAGIGHFFLRLAEREGAPPISSWHIKHRSRPGGL